MATVSETGWPYVQHRGGPKGFVRVLDERVVERFFKVRIEAVDWNCPQGITPRYTLEEIRQLVPSP